MFKELCVRLRSHRTRRATYINEPARKACPEFRPPSARQANIKEAQTPFKQSAHAEKYMNGMRVSYVISRFDRAQRYNLNANDCTRERVGNATATNRSPHQTMHLPTDRRADPLTGRFTHKTATQPTPIMKANPLLAVGVKG